MTTRALVKRQPAGLPPILAGRATPAVTEKVKRFYSSAAEIFEAWVRRRSSAHTQRAYRQDVITFVRYIGIRWPHEAPQLFTVSVGEVHAWREHLKDQGAAPKTLHRRISSLSSFYKYLAAAAAELRRPITVPNPAHAQFIGREATDAREETRHLTATRARQLMGFPAGDTLVDFRDRAILKTYLYTGARLASVCRLKVSDFHDDEEDAKLTLSEKGGRHCRPRVRLQHPLDPRHHGDPAAGRRRQHPQGPGPPRPPPHHHDADLRQAPANHQGECQPRRAGVTPPYLFMAKRLSAM